MFPNLAHQRTSKELNSKLAKFYKKGLVYDPNSLTNLSNKRIGDVPVLLATDLLEPATRPVGEPSLISLEGIPSVRQVGTIKQKALTGYNEIRGYH